jgi:glycosyltransferase involved in cell wall biosynthesis
VHVLFAHPNFPAQFRCVAPRLARDYGWQCTFVTRNDRAPAVPGVERIVYHRRGGATAFDHPAGRPFENALADADGVYRAMKERPGVAPDLVVAHSGFGSSLFLPHLYDAPVVNFFEWFYHPAGHNLGYRPDQRVDETALLRHRGGNAMILMDLENCDAGWCPGFYQRDLFPREYRGKIEVIPEGIDTDLYRRRAGAPRVLPDGTAVPAGTRVVTYVSRGLEPMRGFDVFMKAATRVYEQFPDVLFVVVGSDRECYGNAAAGRGAYRSFRERVLAEGDYDLSKFVFTGRVPEAGLRDLLSISDLHIYLTVPFVTSWSMLDAMSCSCVVLASDQACTREYITHGRNGLLCDFFDVEGMAQQAVEVLRDPAAYRALGAAARATIEAEYSVDVCLPRIKALFERVAAKGPRTPSLRAEVICGAGLRPAHSGSLQGVQAGSPHHKEYPPYDGSVPFGAAPRGVHCLSEPVDGSDGPRVGDGRPFGVPQGDPNGEPLAPAGADPSAGPRTVLFCWELGGGLGHLMQMLPLAEDLAAAGHRVLVALRHLEGATAVFGGAGVTFLQAPGRFAPARAKCPRPASFAQMLANLGFADDFELFAVACAWRNLFKMVGPDLVVFDHSPTALLAARGMEFGRALIGSGFCCPPDVSPLPVFRPELAGTIDPAKLAAFEAGVLGRVNRQLGHWGEGPLERLGQLYGEVDENFLTTFPELDHYPDRPGAAYWGPVVVGRDGGGDEAAWPDAPGRRVFAYLKPFGDLPNVLAALGEAGRPTIVYAEGVAPAVRKRFASPTLAFAEGPLDLARVAGECDLAVLNGGHGATAEMLLAGRPLVQIPLALEQRLTADAVERLGAGARAGARDAAGVGAAVERVLGDPSYTRAAGRFAQRYGVFDPARQRSAIRERALGLLGPGARPDGATPDRPRALCG